MTLPRSPGPHPAVVLITGSGPQDRDYTVSGHRPFLVWADYLTRRGFAVLRTDDRGVGGSGGKLLDSTDEDFARDVLAEVEWLKRRKDIDAARIGLLGHSEGAARCLDRGQPVARRRVRRPARRPGGLGRADPLRASGAGRPGAWAFPKRSRRRIARR